jgi:prepilin-type processing-associated H-X9-DG protein
MLSRKPSPAAVIACLALFVALGGTGYGAVKINGKNLKNGSVTGPKLQKNTLTGKQINESKLGTVPRAKTATTATTATHALSADTTPAAANATAVNGQKLERFSLTVASDGPHQTASAGNVGLVASCSGGHPMLEAHNATAQAAALEANWIHNDSNPAHPSQFHDESFTSDDSDDVAQDGSGGGTAVVAFADGSVTSIDYGFMDDSQNNGNGCRFFGRAISG